MKSLHKDEFAEYFLDAEHAAVIQCWSEATASMTEQQFRLGVELLAELIERKHVRNVLVDIVQMRYRPAEDFEPWRQAYIIPRYNAAGVRRFAFLMPGDAPGVVENGVSPAPEGKAGFPFGYFSSRDRAFAWFNDAQG